MKVAGPRGPERGVFSSSVAAALVMHLAMLAAAVSFALPKAPEPMCGPPVPERTIEVVVEQSSSEEAREEPDRPDDDDPFDDEAFPEIPQVVVWDPEPAFDPAADDDFDDVASLPRLKPIQPAVPDPVRPRRARKRASGAVLGVLSSSATAQASFLTISNTVARGRLAGGVVGGVLGGTAVRDTYGMMVRRAISQSPRWREAARRSTRAVKLRLTLSADGSVVNVRVVRSSGDADQDAAAVAAARSTRLPKPPGETRTVFVSLKAF